MTDEKRATVHLIGNAHIDPVWLWRWQEGFAEVKATFRSALDRMEETDDYVFTSSSVIFYKWVEENDPGMFAEICGRVEEGRWSVVGGWWIEPDCNIPGARRWCARGYTDSGISRRSSGGSARWDSASIRSGMRGRCRSC